MRKVVSLLSSVVIVAASVAPAALANSSTVTNTGDGNTTTTTTTNVQNTQVNNNNNMFVGQMVAATANSGGVVQSRNVGAGSVTTGDSVVGVGLNVAGNTNATAVDNSNANDTGNVSEVVNTGDKNTVITRDTEVDNTTVNNNNTARVMQGVMTSANSGGVVQDRNVEAGSVTTGNNVVDVDLDVNANHNATAISNGDGLLGPLGLGDVNGASVTNTGNNNTYRTTSVDVTNTLVNNNNRLAVVQMVAARSNSGGVLQSRNVQAGDVMTGGSVVNVGANITGNMNATEIGTTDGLFPLGLGLGNWHEIVNTGDKNTSTARTTTVLNTNVNNNNTVIGTQFVLASSSTGRVAQVRNVQAGSTTTGVSGVGVGATYTVNQNYTSVNGGLLGLAGLLLPWWMI